MSPPTAEVSLPRRPPIVHRLALNAVAVILVVSALLLTGNPSSTALVPGSSPTDASRPTVLPDNSAVPAVSPSASNAVASSFLQFVATADAYVYAGRPELNYGGLAELRVDADPETMTYLQFAVSGIHGQVLGVSLLIHALGRQTRGFQVRTAPSDWAESEITYGLRPTPGGDVIGTSGLVAGEALLEVKLTTVIDGDGQYSLVLLTSSTTGLAFASREAGPATAPLLIVEVAKGAGG